MKYDSEYRQIAQSEYRRGLINGFILATVCTGMWAIAMLVLAR